MEKNTSNFSCSFFIR